MSDSGSHSFFVLFSLLLSSSFALNGSKFLLDGSVVSSLLSSLLSSKFNSNGSKNFAVSHH
jgi:hypothetical protein